MTSVKRVTQETLKVYRHENCLFREMTGKAIPSNSRIPVTERT
jgi:hypothetical protein